MPTTQRLGSYAIGSARGGGAETQPSIERGARFGEWFCYRSRLQGRVGVPRDPACPCREGAGVWTALGRVDAGFDGVATSWSG
jgi:hypothetical protein